MKLPRYVHSDTDVPPNTVLRWAQIDARKLGATDACELLYKALTKAFKIMGEKPYDDDKTCARTLRLASRILTRWGRLSARQRPSRRKRRFILRLLLESLHGQPVDLLDFMERAPECWRIRRLLEREIGPNWRGHVRSLNSPE